MPSPKIHLTLHIYNRLANRGPKTGFGGISIAFYSVYLIVQYGTGTGS